MRNFPHSLRESGHGEWASMRYCIWCGRVTKFKLDAMWQHSACEECGSFDAVSADNEREIAIVQRLGPERYIFKKAMRALQRRKNATRQADYI